MNGVAPGRALPIHVLRARRTAALCRAALSLVAITLAIGWPALALHPALLIVGFALVLTTAGIQLVIPSSHWLIIEESLAPVAGALIVGLGGERVNVLPFLWLAAVASGVLARGGRAQHWVGRAILLVSLTLPGRLRPGMTPSYGAFYIAVLALLLTCGRVTQELRTLLDGARWDADHDGLTGTLSRAAFRMRLDQLPDAASRVELSLLLVDLDNFGAVNKSSGHAAGDAVLVSVAKCLQRWAGSDGLVGRLGGDEFAVVVRTAEPEVLAQHVMDELEGIGDGQVPVAASIGIAMMPRDGDDGETVLRASDIACESLSAAASTRSRATPADRSPTMARRRPGGAAQIDQR